MMTLNKYVALDVHKDTTEITVAEEGRMGTQSPNGTIASILHVLKRARQDPDSFPKKRSGLLRLLPPRLDS